MWKLLTYFGLVLGSIQDCGKNSQFQLTSLDFVPAAPKAGESIFMTVQFNNPGTEVSDGSVTTSVTYNFLPLTPTVEPLCVNTQCPLVNGFNDRSTNSTWPSGVSGTIVSTITWNDNSGSELLCIKLTVKSGYSGLRGNKVSPGISLFREEKVCKHLVVYRQWIKRSKKNRKNSSKTPEAVQKMRLKDY
jgi:hypothetical protein